MSPATVAKVYCWWFEGLKKKIAELEWNLELLSDMKMWNLRNSKRFSKHEDLIKNKQYLPAIPQTLQNTRNLMNRTDPNEKWIASMTIAYNCYWNAQFVLRATHSQWFKDIVSWGWGTFDMNIKRYFFSSSFLGRCSVDFRCSISANAVRVHFPLVQ